MSFSAMFLQPPGSTDDSKTCSTTKEEQNITEEHLQCLESNLVCKCVCNSFHQSCFWEGPCSIHTIYHFKQRGATLGTLAMAEIAHHLRLAQSEPPPLSPRDRRRLQVDYVTPADAVPRCAFGHPVTKCTQPQNSSCHSCSSICLSWK